MKLTSIFLLIVLPLHLHAQPPELFGTYTLDHELGFETLRFGWHTFEYNSSLCGSELSGAGHWEIRDEKLILEFDEADAPQDTAPRQTLPTALRLEDNPAEAHCAAARMIGGHLHPAIVNASPAKVAPAGETWIFHIRQMNATELVLSNLENESRDAFTWRK